MYDQIDEVKESGAIYAKDTTSVMKIVDGYYEPQRSQMPTSEKAVEVAVNSVEHCLEEIEDYESIKAFELEETSYYGYL